MPRTNQQRRAGYAGRREEVAAQELSALCDSLPPNTKMPSLRQLEEKHGLSIKALRGVYDRLVDAGRAYRHARAGVFTGDPAGHVSFDKNRYQREWATRDPEKIRAIEAKRSITGARTAYRRLYDLKNNASIRERRKNRRRKNGILERRRGEKQREVRRHQPPDYIERKYNTVSLDAPVDGQRSSWYDLRADKNASDPEAILQEKSGLVALIEASYSLQDQRVLYTFSETLSHELTGAICGCRPEYVEALIESARALASQAGE